MRIANTTLRSWTIALLTVGSVICLLGAVGGDNTTQRITLVFWAYIAAAWAFRSRRMGVELGDGALVVRGFLRTKVVAWANIDDVIVANSAIAFVLRSGEVVRALATVSSNQAKLDQMCLAVINARAKFG